MYPNQVIINQPQVVVASRPYREWTHGLCGCCDECGDCLFAYFCTWCYLCELTKNANVSFFTICCGGLVPIRTKIRTERKIRGTIIDDYYSVGCCGFCAMIQMNRECRDTEPLI